MTGRTERLYLVKDIPEDAGETWPIGTGCPDTPDLVDNGIKFTEEGGVVVVWKSEGSEHTGKEEEQGCSGTHGDLR